MRVLNHPILGTAKAAQEVDIEVDGRTIRAIEGEPIAAAMMASGITVFHHTHRGSPRGIFCAIGRCSDCLMVVDGVPNVRVCVTPVRAGMRVTMQSGPGRVLGDDDQSL